MLPFVLGGIALAAVGYGVKELCESEGCPWDENNISYQSSQVERFDRFQKIRVALQSKQLQRLRELLIQVTHTDTKYTLDNVVSLKKEKLEEGVLYEDVELYMGMYEASIRKATRLADDYIVNLITMLEISCDYANYGKSEKKIIKKAYKLINATQKLLVLQLLDKDDSLNIHIIKPLKEYEDFLEKYKTHNSIYPFSHSLAFSVDNTLLK